MKKAASILLLLVAMALPVAAQEYYAEKIELPESSLKNFYRIDEGVYRSDQPSKKDFVALEKFGIREVVNLRARHNDRAEAKGTRLILHHIRTKANNISEDEVVEALKIIKEREGPVLIHCWHGSDRTGAVAAMYRIIFQGVGKEEAIRELTQGGFGFHAIFGNIPEMIRNADTQRIKKELGLELFARQIITDRSPWSHAVRDGQSAER